MQGLVALWHSPCLAGHCTACGSYSAFDFLTGSCDRRQIMSTKTRDKKKKVSVSWCTFFNLRLRDAMSPCPRVVGAFKHQPLSGTGHCKQKAKRNPSCTRWVKRRLSGARNQRTGRAQCSARSRCRKASKEVGSQFQAARSLQVQVGEVRTSMQGLSANSCTPLFSVDAPYPVLPNNTPKAKQTSACPTMCGSREGSSSSPPDGHKISSHTRMDIRVSLLLAWWLFCVELFF